MELETQATEKGESKATTVSTKNTDEDFILMHPLKRNFISLDHPELVPFYKGSVSCILTELTGIKDLIIVVACNAWQQQPTVDDRPSRCLTSWDDS